MASSERLLSTWLAAARPRTLPAAVVPVIVGLAIAFRSGPIQRGPAITTMTAALLIQIGTNLANDYYDFLKGADDASRLGPLRVTQAGLISPSTVKLAAFSVLGLAGVLGLYLVSIGGWPILLVGLLSLLSALAYTAGPWPIAYHGLGEIFVFLFFGVVAVNGTAYLQTGGVTLLSLVASLPIACLATAILVVNNLRDIPTDERAGKRTLAVRLGEGATRRLYLALLVATFAILPLLAWMGGPAMLAAFAALPVAVREARALRVRTGAALNSSLAGTAKLHLIYGLLLSLGLAL